MRSLNILKSNLLVCFSLLLILPVISYAGDSTGGLTPAGEERLAKQYYKIWLESAKDSGLYKNVNLDLEKAKLLEASLQSRLAIERNRVRGKSSLSDQQVKSVVREFINQESTIRGNLPEQYSFAKRVIEPQKVVTPQKPVDLVKVENNQGLISQQEAEAKKIFKDWGANNGFPKGVDSLNRGQQPFLNYFLKRKRAELGTENLDKKDIESAVRSFMVNTVRIPEDKITIGKSGSGGSRSVQVKQPDSNLKSFSTYFDSMKSTDGIEKKIVDSLVVYAPNDKQKGYKYSAIRNPNVISSYFCDKNNSEAAKKNIRENVEVYLRDHFPAYKAPTIEEAAHLSNFVEGLHKAVLAKHDCKKDTQAPIVAKQEVSEQRVAKSSRGGESGVDQKKKVKDVSTKAVPTKTASLQTEPQETFKIPKIPFVLSEEELAEKAKKDAQNAAQNAESPAITTTPTESSPEQVVAKIKSAGKSLSDLENADVGVWLGDQKIRELRAKKIGVDPNSLIPSGMAVEASTAQTEPSALKTPLVPESNVTSDSVTCDTEDAIKILGISDAKHLRSELIKVYAEAQARNMVDKSEFYADENLKTDINIMRNYYQYVVNNKESTNAVDGKYIGEPTDLSNTSRLRKFATCVRQEGEGTRSPIGRSHGIRSVSGAK